MSDGRDLFDAPRVTEGGPTLGRSNPTEPLPPSNVPLELTTFVGRRKDLATLTHLLHDQRLVTLTGAGGCGKTRLALEVARRVGGFSDGIWVVDLAPVTDPDLVAKAVAYPLHVDEQTGRSLTDTLAQQLNDKGVLLVLDNCEHLIDACATLAEVLLRSCPDVRILATSREALRIPGEVAWPVPSLSLPDLRLLSDIESLGRFESAHLFLDRLAAVQPGFHPDADDATAIAQICYRLDGIPLALELAAGRARMLTVREIADRLDDCFRLLSVGMRTAMPRHRTLHATMEWSHDLLSVDEQTLFRCLSVFTGGFLLEAAESVCPGAEMTGADVLLLLSHLVDKSLVRVRDEADRTRYQLLEMVRQYASQKLDATGLAGEVRRRHAVYYAELTEHVVRDRGGPNQPHWLPQLEADQGNLRSALSWSLAEGGDPATGVRIAAALWPFWSARGDLSEGRNWLRLAIAASRPLASASRSRAAALNGAGVLAMMQDETELAKSLIEEGLQLYRDIGDSQGIASSLVNLGSVAWLGQRNDIPMVALAEEAARIMPQIEDRHTRAQLLTLQGGIALAQGDRDLMASLNEESVALSRTLGDTHGVAMGLMNMGLVAVAHGDHHRATTLLGESLRLARDLGHKLYIHYCIIGLAGAAAAAGERERAAHLWAAAEMIGKTYGTQFTRAGRALIDYEGALAGARSSCDEAAWSLAWAQGAASSIEQAVQYALEPTSNSMSADQMSPPAGLSTREIEVLRLVAAGRTSAEIADTLFVSTRTVNWHLGSIYRKLGLRSRTEATRFALERGIV
jgi:predicted ATPase/DNA-binding CsgD family transcriptional regulator